MISAPANLNALWCLDWQVASDGEVIKTRRLLKSLGTI